MTAKTRKAARSVKYGERVLCALMLILLMASSSTPQIATQLSPPRGAVPKTYFGLHIHHLFEDTEWPSVPFGTWRLWDAHVMWTYLEPARDKYDFSLLDKFVQAAQDHDVEIVLTLAGTPAWASARPSEVPVHAGGFKSQAGLAAEPASESTWSDFLNTVASRYKGRIHYYEVWNEPMSEPFFSGTPQDMARLAKTAATVLKQVDPSIKIVSPPVTADDKGLSWLTSFLQAGGGQYVDIYGFHLYIGGPPEKGLPKIERARALLRSSGQGNKPIWNTEAGWEISKLDQRTASNYVARTFLLDWPLGIGRFMLYSWDSPQMGIAPSGNGSTPMVAAYATIERWLLGSTVSRCVGTQSGLWVENLTLANGAQAKIVWTAVGQVKLNKDNIGNATEYTTLGNETIRIGPDTAIYASESPILLYGN